VHYLPENQLTKLAHLVQFKCVLVFSGRLGAWAPWTPIGYATGRQSPPAASFSHSSVCPLDNDKILFAYAAAAAFTYLTGRCCDNLPAAIISPPVYMQQTTSHVSVYTSSISEILDIKQNNCNV